MAADAHVKGAGIKLVEFFLAASDASGGEEGSHRVTDGFLHVGEGVMGAVGSSESICTCLRQCLAHSRHIALGQHDIGVKDAKILALGTFGTIVTARARTRVGLVEIADVERSCISVAHLLAGNGGTILHYHHLKIALCLQREALEQFVHLVGSVENGNDDGVFHSVAKKVGKKKPRPPCP